MRNYFDPGTRIRSFATLGLHHALTRICVFALRRVGEERRNGNIVSRCLEQPQFDLATTFVEASASPNEQELLMARHTLDRMEMAARRLVDLSTGAQVPIPAQASPQQQLDFDELLANSTVFKKLSAELSVMSVACDEISNDVLASGTASAISCFANLFFLFSF